MNRSLRGLLGWTPLSMEPDSIVFAQLEVASDGSLFVLTDVLGEDVVRPRQRQGPPARPAALVARRVRHALQPNEEVVS
jgi:hypothetical protein